MPSKLKETVYSPASASRNPVKVIKEIVLEFKQANSLGWRLASRNIKAQYRQSILGLFWAILPPLATSLVWIILNAQKVVAFEGLSVPYPVFVFTGTLLWQLFSKSITLVLSSVQSNKSLLSKINFPREALIISAFYEILFHALISLGLILVMLLVYQVPIGIYTLLGMISSLSIILFGITIGLMVFPLSMLYRDIQLGIPIILQFAMYLTPIIYPTPNYSGWAKILAYNPVSPLILTTRNWLLADAQVNPQGYLLVLAITLAALILGLVLYRLSMTIIIERIGS